MAGEDRQETNSVSEAIFRELREKPYSYDFFHVMRDLENAYSWRPKIGTSISPRQEPIRLGQSPRLAFAPSTLEKFEDANSARPPKLSVNFLGLTGPNGPLPLEFTEYIRERLRNMRDSTLTGFLDMFHHRLISLFYRAWAVNQKAADFDRPEESRFSTYIGSFLGLGDPTMRSRDKIPDDAKIYFSGHLSAATRDAEGLESILSDFFEVPVELDAMIGDWLPITERYHCLLGIDRENASLGQNAILGAKVWDVQNRFRLRIGPMPFKRYCDFLPTAESFAKLVDWVAFYTSFQFRWDLQVSLEAEEVPQTQLGGGSLLGWTSWLTTETPTRDAGDLIIDQSESRTEKEHHES